jgi:glycosidase
MKTLSVIKMNAFVLGLILIVSAKAQVIDVNPMYPTENDGADITFHVDRCDCNLEGYTGDIYAHTGLITSESADANDWKYVIADWNENIAKAKLEKINNTTYVLHITPDVASYYEITGDATTEQFAFVFRSSDGTKQTANIYYDIYEPGLTVQIVQPEGDMVVKSGDTIRISALSVALGTSLPDSVTLLVDDTIEYVSNADTLFYEYIVNSAGKHWVKVEAENAEYTSIDSFFFFVRNDLTILELPEGVMDGINYIDTSTVTLVLHAPYKDNVLVIGDFNDWNTDNNYLMNRTPDEERYWITITNLEKGVEYAFQYLVDGDLRIADPYADKILDPVNDPEIPESTYPDLKPYSYGKTTGIVSVLQTAQQGYPWAEIAFIPAKVTDLVIYELLVRDFSDARTFATVIDSLNYLISMGVNAIELMPVSEFEGNESWGYNPSFYFAVDKYYGTKNDYKRFIDECHKNGIAVIQDIVLNHSYSQSPMVQLYLDEVTGNPTDESPWYNPTCPHNPWCWGFDFNHESPATKAFVHRVNRYWLEEYHVDGFRFDFTKGFTNHIGDGWVYDASRIAILKEMYDSIKSFNEHALVIFEHLSENTEETELANYGILLWGKMTSQYNEATMGYHENNKSNLSGISYQYRGWDEPHLVGYMESHDEERLMYKNQTWGNASGNYDTKDLITGLRRVEAAANFFFTVPGPKMLWQFGELGYDISIDEPCRVCNKPILWEYYDDPARYRLYKVFSALIKLRTEEGMFETTDFTMNVASAVKSLHLNSTEMNATILGNFDVTNNSVTASFQHTGTWYEYYTGTSIEVTDVDQVISLRPGEYRLYTDVQLEIPDIPVFDFGITIDKQGSILLYPNPNQGIITILPVSAGQMTFELLDLSGKSVFKTRQYFENMEPYSFSIDREGMDPERGIYMYLITTPENSYAGKLILE